MRELWRGNANAWECDEMGHLNVKGYLAKASEAVAWLAAELGLPTGERAIEPSRLLPTQAHIRFLAEARPGTPLAIVGGVLAVGGDDLAVYLEMRDAAGKPAAAITLRMAHVSVALGRAFPWPKRMGAAVEPWRVSLPEHGEAKGVALDPPALDISVARADSLDVPRIGQGVFRPDEADAFDLVRPHVLLGRVSDSGPNLFGSWRGEDGGAGLGGAILEARLVFRAWPSPGDRFVLRSGFAALSGRTCRAVHWILDPATGDPWCSGEVVSGFFDLAARKIVAAPAASRRRLEAFLRPEMRA